MIGIAQEDPEFLALFDGSPHAPTPVAEGETGARPTALPNALRAEFSIALDDHDMASLSDRARRSEAETIETRLLVPGKEAAALADLTGKADLVLVDAPCSGTGTWRRNPEARWRMNKQIITCYAESQCHLLEIAAPLVKQGGYLVYIVCSLLAREGETQISAFLNSRSDFSKVDFANGQAVAAGEGYLLTPARHGTDGFFFARLERAC